MENEATFVQEPPWGNVKLRSNLRKTDFSVGSGFLRPYLTDLAEILHTHY